MNTKIIRRRNFLKSVGGSAGALALGLDVQPLLADDSDVLLSESIAEVTLTTNSQYGSYAAAEAAIVNATYDFAQAQKNAAWGQGSPEPNRGPRGDKTEVENPQVGFSPAASSESIVQNGPYYEIQATGDLYKEYYQ